MRNEAEIQRAHDLLKGFLHLLADPTSWRALHEKTGGELENIGDLPQMIASLDVLCWILDHTNNIKFSKNILQLEAWLFGIGIELKDSGELQFPDVDQKREG